MVVFASKKLGRPVKWTETRSENYKATIHGRDHVQEVELGGEEGRHHHGPAGQGLGQPRAPTSRPPSTGIPTILHGLMLSGAYTIPNIHEDVYGMFTNTTPVDAYRGAGRPEATFIVERLVDLVAAELKMDPRRPAPEELHPALHGRPHGGHRAHLRHRQLRGRARQGACRWPTTPGLRKKQAELRGEGRVHRHRPLHLRGDLRPRPLAGGGRGRLRRRALGERDRALPSLGQGARDGRRLAARPGRGDDLRPDRGRASWASPWTT